MYQLAQQGHRVVVYTVMAGRPPHDLPDSPILQDLHARWGMAQGYDPVVERRQEDIRALRVLGVTARHGTLPDCVYRVAVGAGGARQALYPDEAALWGPLHPADTAPLLLDAMPLVYPQTQVLHVPLGAGGHVDHRLVRDWGRYLARLRRDLAVYYYEEYPYSTGREAMNQALGAFSPHEMQPVLRPFDESALQAKIDAIACYQSQLSTFWQDAADMAQAVRQYAARVARGPASAGAGFSEREWMIRPGTAPPG